VISILGASGSGKSTLLRCINLLETPDAGVVSVGVKPLR
jgi:octopine/nopaline transport system ATP-binding protein